MPTSLLRRHSGGRCTRRFACKCSPQRGPMHSTPASAAPLPPPPVSYSYDLRTRPNQRLVRPNQRRGQHLVRPNQRRGHPGRTAEPVLPALGLGAADGSVQLPNMDESLSALLAKEGAAATVILILGSLPKRGRRRWRRHVLESCMCRAATSPSPSRQCTRRTLKTIHWRQSAQLAPKLRSPTDGGSAVSGDSAVSWAEGSAIGRGRITYVAGRR